MLNTLFNVYSDIPRHWCPYSERYTGCDSLLSAIDQGWHLEDTAFIQHHWSNKRMIPIYYFYLRKDGQISKMRIIENPYVAKILRTYNIKVRPRQIIMRDIPAPRKTLARR